MHSIDIISDVSCPWCIIGYQALHAAIKEAGFSDKVRIHWKPFELNPKMPAEGQERAEHIMMKYGITQAQAEQNRNNLVERGEQEGYHFNFQPGGRVYNTFDAHRLLHWAADSGQQTKLKLALFDLYFQANGNPSDHAQLLSVVEKVGLDVDRARAILNTDEYSNEVRADQEWNYQNGITAVPTFVLDNQFMISGGQQKETFIKALEHLASNSASPTDG